ncbi:ankyrin repeat-containing protein [Anaeramoeba flamelloides]|uniref:Ankyrin repeat-containing protein n=1 Tax=Anaeramoeba flamelloides TaxID=1746091 RepID=A0ABQ8ZB51_9EUKA|nr:ankyrin repeat-containing protein [Anaeramoeba flamelloides]
MFKMASTNHNKQSFKKLSLISRNADPKNIATFYSFFHIFLNEDNNNNNNYKRKMQNKINKKKNWNKHNTNNKNKNNNNNKNKNNNRNSSSFKNNKKDLHEKKKTVSKKNTKPYNEEKKDYNNYNNNNKPSNKKTQNKNQNTTKNTKEIKTKKKTKNQIENNTRQSPVDKNLTKYGDNNEFASYCRNDSVTLEEIKLFTNNPKINVNYIDNSSGDSILLKLCMNPSINESILEHLIQMKVDINYQNKITGNTAISVLYKVEYLSKLSCIKLLIRDGLDVTIKYKSGNTFFDHICQSKYFRSNAKMLLVSILSILLKNEKEIENYKEKEKEKETERKIVRKKDKKREREREKEWESKHGYDSEDEFDIESEEDYDNINYYQVRKYEDITDPKIVEILDHSLITLCSNRSVNTTFLTILIKNGANCNCKLKIKKLNLITTPLIELCKNSRNTCELLKILIHNGADPNISDSKQKTALNYLCQNKKLGLYKRRRIKILLETLKNNNNIDKTTTTPPIETKTETKTKTKTQTETKTQTKTKIINILDLPIDLDSDYAKLLKLLLEYGADPNIKDKEHNGDSILFLLFKEYKKDRTNRADSMDDYCDFDYFEENFFMSLKLVIDYGADLNITNSKGRTLLMEMCQYSKISDVIFSYLLESGANVNQQDNKGLTALMHLCRNLNVGNYYISKFLDQNIKINLTSYNCQNTALHYLFENIHFNSRNNNFFLKFKKVNANFFLPNKRGIKPIDYFSKKKKRQVLSIISKDNEIKIKNVEKNEKAINYRKCNVCNKTKGLSICTSCKEVYYCGKECQRKDWKNHKEKCLKEGEKKEKGKEKEKKNNNELFQDDDDPDDSDDDSDDDDYDYDDDYDSEVHSSVIGTTSTSESEEDGESWYEKYKDCVDSYDSSSSDKDWKTYLRYYDY